METGGIKYSTYKKYITPFNEFISNFNSNKIINQNNNIEKFKLDLIYIIIHLFYYDKYLIEKKETIFDENMNYYLITHQWLNEYKNFYNLQNIEEVLKNIDKKYPKINYNNLDTYFSEIKKICLNNIHLNISQIELPNNIKDINRISTIDNEFKNVQNGYIIPSDIFDIIKKWGFKSEEVQLNNFQINIKVMNKHIYLYNQKKIVIGNIKNKLFNIKYILFYNSIDIYNKEKDYISKLSFENYIQKRNLVDSDSNIKILIDEKGNNLGKIYYFSNINNIIFTNKKNNSNNRAKTVVVKNKNRKEEVNKKEIKSPNKLIKDNSEKLNNNSTFGLKKNNNEKKLYKKNT
jgi:hypothetical protein